MALVGILLNDFGTCFRVTGCYCYRKYTSMELISVVIPGEVYQGVESPLLRPSTGSLAGVKDCGSFSYSQPSALFVLLIINAAEHQSYTLIIDHNSKPLYLNTNILWITDHHRADMEAQLGIGNVFRT